MRRPATARGPRLIQIQKYTKFGYVSGTGTLRKLKSEVVSRFPALRFDVVSPYRDSRYYGAPKPGKEKQKGYNYCSAILIVHRFRSFLSAFTSVCVRSGARLRGKSLPSLKHGAVAKIGRAREPLELRNHRSRMHTRYGRVDNSPQPDLR